MIWNIVNILHVFLRAKYPLLGIQEIVPSYFLTITKKLYVMAQKHQMSIPTWSFDNGEATRFDLKDEMPENAIVNERIQR